MSRDPICDVTCMSLKIKISQESDCLVILKAVPNEQIISLLPLAFKCVIILSNEEQQRTSSTIKTEVV